VTRRPFRAAMTAAAVLGAAAALAPVASAAPVLFGATGASDTDTLPASNLYTVNPNTGAATSVGSIGKAITGLAYDDTSATLYGVTAGVSLDGTERQLLVINQTNGSSTVVGSLGTNEIEDIAFNGNGELYGWNESGDDLVRIDKATGAVTKVGESNLGVTFGNGLAFNPQGQLFGFLDGDFGHVSRIDPATGAVTTGAHLSSSPNKTGTMISWADVDCDSVTMWGVVNDFGGATNLVTIDTLTGAITNKGSSVRGLDAIAWAGCRQTSVGGTVPATLSISIGSPATFGPFAAGVAKDYDASTAANVITTAGDAALSVADPSSNSPGHLVNGAFSLPSALQAKATNAANPNSAFGPVSGTPLNLLAYSNPASNDTVTLTFRQTIGANDALRTGTYSKTLTFTLSTTTP
jgi:Repeat of unknown function (DUF6923)